MGAPVGMGLGLALAQPTKRVLVITGDGDMLMSLGSLATVATQMPENLAIIVLDNEKFGETGNQATHTSPLNNGPTDSGAGTDLAINKTFAAKMGVSQPVLARIESSLGSRKHAPSLETLRKYALACGKRLVIGMQ